MVCNKNIKNVSHYENELMKSDIANFLKEKCWLRWSDELLQIAVDMFPMTCYVETVVSLTRL